MQFLHGIPGILGAVSGAIFAFSADTYMENKAERDAIFGYDASYTRTMSAQGWAQLGALGMTLACSIIGGAISGLIASNIGGKLDKLYDDDAHFVHADKDHVPLRDRINSAVQLTKKVDIN